MSLIDWAAAWNPVPDDRPCRVWLPSDPPTHGTPAPRRARPPQRVVLTLSDADAEDLPCRLSGLLSQTDAQLGDSVTVDLASAASVHLTGLELLLAVLWRRVGPSGDVTLVGGAPDLRTQLTSLGITPDASRAAVHGPVPPAPPLTGSADGHAAGRQRTVPARSGPRRPRHSARRSHPRPRVAAPPST